VASWGAAMLRPYGNALAIALGKKAVSIGSVKHLLSGDEMANESITSSVIPRASGFSREDSGRRPPTALFILFEIISLAFLARVSWGRFSWQRRGSRLLFWGLIVVMAMIAAAYSMLFRDVPLRPAY
jgi:hypothetical protein